MRPDATTVNARRGGVGQSYKLYIRARCGHGLLLLDVPKADRRFSMVQWTRYNQLADTHAKVCRSSVSDHLIPAILPGKMGEQDQATSDESQRPKCMITKIWVCYIERSRLIPGYVWGMEGQHTGKWRYHSSPVIAFQTNDGPHLASCLGQNVPFSKALPRWKCILYSFEAIAIAI